MLNSISKRHYRGLILLFVIFTGSPSSWAKAKKAPRGSKTVIVLAEDANNPLETIKPLNNLSADFYDFLMRFQGQVVPGKALQEQISLVENQTEKYLQSLGVIFTKELLSKEDFNFEGTFIQKATFTTFQIQSVEASEDLNSQFFAAMKSDIHTQDLKLVLNPFLQMTTGAIQGYFEPQSKSLVFGITALSYRVGGLGDTLAHEARHAYEHAKLLDGEFTLASWVLRSSQKTNVVYSDFVRLDEIETHRQDVDYLVNKAPEFEKYFVDKSSLGRLREARAETLKFKQETLQRLTQSSRQFLQKLSQLLTSGTSNLSCVAEARGPLLFCQVSGVQGGAYDAAEIRFVNDSKPATQQIQELIQQSLDQLL